MPFTPMPDSYCDDAVVEGVVYKLRRRSRVGQNKYGTTLEMNKDDLVKRLNHLHEELMDGCNYIEWALRKLDEATPKVHKRQDKIGEHNLTGTGDDVRTQ